MSMFSGKWNFRAFCKHRLLRALILMICYSASCLTKAAMAMDAQATVVTISNSVQAAGIDRPGINLGGLAPYGTQQLYRSINYANGGYMPGTYFSASFLCGAGLQSSTAWYNDLTHVTGYPANFWVGASFTAINSSNGTSYGSGTVTASTANNGSTGTTFTLSPALSAACNPSQHDVIIVKQTARNTLLSPQQAYGGAFCSGAVWNTTDTSPASSNTQQSLQMPDSCAANFAMDAVVQNNTNTNSSLAPVYVPWLNLNGTYTATFKAKCRVAGCSLAASLVRGGGATYVPSTSVSPSPGTLPGTGWTTYYCNASGCGTSPVTFSASENGAQTEALLYKIVCTGSCLLQDADVIEGSALPGNTTVFRDAVVYELEKIHPGSIRYMDDTQWCATVADQIAPLGNRRWCAYNNYLPAIAGPPIGYADVLSLANLVGADAYISVGVLNQASDWTTLIKWLSTSGWMATYAASGHKIYLEAGNEAWNTSGGQDLWAGNGIAYGSILGQDMAAAKAASGYNSSVVKLVANGWAAHGQGDSIYGWTAIALNTAGCTLSSRTTCPDYVEIATYNFSYLGSYNTSGSSVSPVGKPFIDQFAEIADFNSVGTQTSNYYYAGGSTYFNQRFVQSSYNLPTAVYETNIGMIAGTAASQLQLNQIAGGVANGLTLLENILLAQRDAGVTGPQNVFQLAQNGFSYNGGYSPASPIWGITRLMATGPGQTPGSLNVDRPSALALEVVNNAIGSNNSLMSITQTGTPTYSYTADQSNGNTPTILGNAAVAYVNCFSYANSVQTNWTLICFNNNLSSSETVTLAGAGAPTGPVTQTLFPNPGNVITDNNEDTYLQPASPAPVVTYPLSTVASGTSYTIPPASMIALTYGFSLSLLPAPTFSPGTGDYSGTQTVTISDSSSAAIIYYSRDGSIPTTNSTVYTGPVTVSTSQTINAIASAPGYAVSPVGSAIYTINTRNRVPKVPAVTYLINTTFNELAASQPLNGAAPAVDLAGSTWRDPNRDWSFVRGGGVISHGPDLTNPALIDVSAADYTATFNYPAVDAVLLFRYVDAGHYLYVRTLSYGAVAVYSNVGGVSTQLAILYTTVPSAALTVTLSGSTATITCAGATATGIIPSTLQSGTQLGFYSPSAGFVISSLTVVRNN